MPATLRRHRLIGSISAAFVLLTALILVPPRAEAVSPNAVISQVYGGGGNNGATYTHDFYTITYEVADSCGNSAIVSATVTVPIDM